MWLFFLYRSRERIWIRLPSIKIYNSSYQFIPLFFIEFSEMISNLYNQSIKRFDSSINVTFFRISYWSESMFLLNDFGEVPKLRRSTHILPLHTVMNCFHMFQSLCSTLQLLILTISTREHSITNDCIFDILMHCRVNIFHFLYSLFDNWLFEIRITIVLPNPIPSKFLKFRLNRIVFNKFFNLNFLHLRFLCVAKISSFIKLRFSWRISSFGHFLL